LFHKLPVAIFFNGDFQTDLKADFDLFQILRDVKIGTRVVIVISLSAKGFDQNNYAFFVTVN